MPHNFNPFGADPFHQRATVAGGVSIVPRQVGKDNIDTIFFSFICYNREYFDQFSMSTSAMIPPRVIQRMGHVGLPAEYSPGQAKV